MEKTIDTSLTSIKENEEKTIEEAKFYNPGFYNLEEEFKTYSQMLQKGTVDKTILFRIGRINHFWDKPDEAFRYYQKALEIEPEYGEVHYNMANIYYEKDNYKKAKEHYIKAVEAKHNDIYALNALGKTCFTMKDFKSSEKYHRLALKYNPEDVYSLRGLGNIYLIKKNFGEALNYYYKAIEINPSDGVSLYNIGLVHLLSGRIENAEKHYKECLQKNYFFGFYFGLGLCSYKQGKKTEAFKNYKIGLSMSPDNSLDFKFAGKFAGGDLNKLLSENHFCKGNAYYSMNNITDAIEELKKTVELNPDFSHVHNFLGKLYLKKGDFVSALKHYEELLELEPENIEVEKEVSILRLSLKPDDLKSLKKLHSIYRAREDYRDEIEILEKITGLTTDFIYFYKLGCAYLFSGQKVKASEAFARLLSPEKKEDLGHIGFALLYASKKDYPRALTSIEKALDIDKKSDYYLEAGNIYRDYNDTDRALECYSEAFKINPYSRLTCRLLIDCLLEGKDREHVSKILSEYSRAPGYNLLLTEFYIRLKEYKKAGKCLFQIEINSKNRSLTHLYLGICYEAEGFFECALEAFISSASSEELKGESYGRMALIYQENGNFNKAKEMVSRALNYTRNIPPVLRYKICILLWELGLKKELEIFIKKATRSINFQKTFCTEQEKDKAVKELNELRKKIHKMKKEPEKTDPSSREREGRTIKKKVKSLVTMLSVDSIALEVGHGLLALIDPNQGAKLLERVNSIRSHIVLELGLILPGIRFSDNLNLSPSGYVIKIRDIEVASGKLILDRFLAIGPEEILKSLKGPECMDPTYGMPAVWITPEERVKAEMTLGCMVFEPIGVIATQLTEVIRGYAHELLGMKETSAILESVKKNNPEVLKEIYPQKLNLGDIQNILKKLIKEKISIKDIILILETLACHGKITTDTDILTEYVRQALSRNICREYKNNQGIINVLELSSELEDFIKASVKEGRINVERNMEKEIFSSMDKTFKKLIEKGIHPIILCSAELRPLLKSFTEKEFPSLVVLSYKEIEHKSVITNLGMLNLPKKIASKLKKRNIFLYIDKMRKDTDELVRCEAMKSLALTADEDNFDKVLSYLDTGLKDDSEKVRLEAARAIRELYSKNRW